ARQAAHVPGDARHRRGELWSAPRPSGAGRACPGGHSRRTHRAHLTSRATHDIGARPSVDLPGRAGVELLPRTGLVATGALALGHPREASLVLTVAPWRP